MQAQLGKKRNWIDSDDLCIMFTAAYKTEFYRALRDALHAEVDSWKQPDISIAQSRRIEDLWKIVLEMEPVSRNLNASFIAGNTAHALSSGVVSVEQLTSSPRA